MRSVPLRLSTILASLVVTVGVARAAGPDPQSVPAQLQSIQSTLDALSSAISLLPGQAAAGVSFIDQSRALAGDITPGDAPGFPVSIKQGGSYRLSSDLVITDLSTTGIEIDTSQPVSIDLNGFSIRGSHNGGPRPCQAITPGNGIGTASNSNSNSVEIRNGTIERMGCDGISLIGFGNLVHDVRVRRNGATGIQITGVISNNSITLNGREGISSFDAVVTGNHVNDNDAEGILLFEGVVSNNSVVRNGGAGLFVPGSGGNPGTRVAYSNNVFNGNNADGVQVLGGIQTGPNVCSIGLVGSLCP